MRVVRAERKAEARMRALWKDALRPERRGSVMSAGDQCESMAQAIGRRPGQDTKAHWANEKKMNENLHTHKKRNCKDKLSVWRNACLWGKLKI